jgi:hypothetical protein
MSNPNPNDLPYGSSLPYKAGDTVRFFQNKSPHYPQDLVVERIFPTREGTRVKFVGVDDPAHPEFIDPIKEETKAESKAMTDIKWIPVYADNLPEGEVLAISDRGVVYLSSFKLVSGVPVIKEEESPTFVVGVAYIPLDHLRQLWAEQNPASRYSRDSEAFKLFEWIMESESNLGKAVVELTVGAEHTIKVLAEQMVRISRLVPGAPSSPHSDADDFLEELIYWIKDYLAS